MEDKENMKDVIKKLSKELGDFHISFKALNLKMECEDISNEMLLYASRNNDKELHKMLVSYYKQQIEILNDLKKEYMK